MQTSVRRRRPFGDARWPVQPARADATRGPRRPTSEKKRQSDEYIPDPFPPRRPISAAPTHFRRDPFPPLKLAN